MANFGAQLLGVANKLIRLFGDGQTVTCRRYEQTGSAVTGKRSRAVAETVSGVEAVVVSENVFEIDGWTAGDEVMILSASNFSSTRLDGSWTVQKAGELERPVTGPIVPVQPGADVVYYQALIKTGAAGG